MAKTEIFELLINKPNGNIQENRFKKLFPNEYSEILSINFPEDFSFQQKLYHYLKNDTELKLGIDSILGVRYIFKKFSKGYTSTIGSPIFDITKDKIFKYITSGIDQSGYYKTISGFSKTFPSHYKELMKMDFPNDFEFQQKLYHYLKNDVELKLGICPVCGKRCKFKRFSEGYHTHCCPHCINLDKNVRKQIGDTKEKRYGDRFFNNRDLCEKTNLLRYGVTNTSKLPEKVEKMRKTSIERYGGIGFASDELNKKSQDTTENRYGKPYIGQVYEFSKFHKKRVLYDNIWFDSSWEVIVYRYFKSIGCVVEFRPNIEFTYEYLNCTHYYQPDFLIDGKIYEVKGDHFFDGDKMINPYDRSQDDKFEAKHQCMLKNGVIILRYEDIKKMKKWLE